MFDKKKLRIELQEKLSKFSKPVYEELSGQIAAKLFAEKDWQQAKVVGITISRFPEVDTYRIIQKAWEQGKLVAVPKCLPQEKKLSFRLLSEFSQLESVYYGLLEPSKEKTTQIDDNKIDLQVVPGLGYTTEGYRLGFGGGYYDRYLQTYAGKTISLAFKAQLIPSFKTEIFDIPVEKIITNEEVIVVK